MADIITLDGKPSITTPKSAVRDVQLAVNNIRERLQQIEAAYNSVAGATDISNQANVTATADIAALLKQIKQLQIDLAAISTRVSTLEGEVPTDVYVDNIFIATRHALNFLSGGGIRVTGSDDTVAQRVNIMFQALVNLTMIVEPGRLLIHGKPIGFLLGTELVVDRMRMLVAGRSLDLLLSSNLTAILQPGRLFLRGQALDMNLSTSSLSLVLNPARMLLAGRTIDFSSTANLNLAIERARYAVRGETLDLVLSNVLTLSIAVAQMRSRGKTLTLTLTGVPVTFFRDFADLSTSNLIVILGTVSASTGNLVGSGNGTNHQRVYFTLLPEGSPSWINLAAGAIDCTAIWVANSSTSSLSAMCFTKDDLASSLTIQNGYWFDLALQLSAGRMVRFTSGSGSQLNSFGYSATSGNQTYRLTRTTGGLWTVFLNGTQKYTQTDTNFVAVRPGVVFFSNPGAPLPLVSYSLTYVP